MIVSLVNMLTKSPPQANFFSQKSISFKLKTLYKSTFQKANMLKISACGGLEIFTSPHPPIGGCSPPVGGEHLGF